MSGSILVNLTDRERSPYLAAAQKITELREALRSIREIIDDKGYSHMPSGFFTSAVTRVNDVLKRCEREKLI